MRIRPATVSDLTAIQDLYQVSSFENYKDIAKHEEIEAVREQYFNTDYLTNELTNPSKYGTWYVAEDDTLVGIILLGFNSETQAEIYSLFVDTTRQSQGIGTELVKYAVKIAKECGATELVVETTEGTNAEHFYKKNEFRIVGKGPSGHFPTSGLVELAMTRPIN